MLNFKLNESETISLDIKTILSCLYICYSNDIISDNNDYLEMDLTKNVLNVPLEIIDTDNKEDIINNKIVRIGILYGLKEKIEKELSLYS